MMYTINHSEITPLKLSQNEQAVIVPCMLHAVKPIASVILNEDGTRILDLYRRGLIPAWAKDQKVGVDVTSTVS